MQNSASTAGPTALLCKAGTRLVYGNFCFRGAPTLPRTGKSGCCAQTACTNNMVYVEHSLSFCKSETLAHAKQRLCV